jgi:hypothetical protein
MLLRRITISGQFLAKNGVSEMAKLCSYTFQDKEGNSYSLDLDFDDAALMENVASVTVTGKKKSAQTNEITSAEFTVALEYKEGPQITISIKGSTLGTIHLQKFGKYLDGIIYNADLVWDRLLNVLDSTGAVERLIGAIPADPVFGCLIKAGISTTVGQLLRCYRECRDAPDWKERDAPSWKETVYYVARCLGTNSARMLMTAIWRTGRCALFAGFG